jgi:F0F1-type ATP synthase membrane subunit c/vacuolar-type H+-ATPase subunit K
MESLIGFVALAAGLIIGLGAFGACMESASWAANTLNPQRASLS